MLIVYSQYALKVLKVSFLLSSLYAVSISPQRVLTFVFFPLHFQISQHFYSHVSATECVSGPGFRSAFISFH